VYSARSALVANTVHSDFIVFSFLFVDGRSPGDFSSIRRKSSTRCSVSLEG
jgi:hypothetical protein